MESGLLFFGGTEVDCTLVPLDGVLKEGSSKNEPAASVLFSKLCKTVTNVIVACSVQGTLIFGLHTYYSN